MRALQRILDSTQTPSSLKRIQRLASDGDDLRRILQRSRSALQAAVNQGRNCVVGRDALGAQVLEADVALP